jgi:hypothetical protein
MALASPYYAFGEVICYRTNLDKHGEASGLGRETFAGSAYTAESLPNLLVRTNLKAKCKTLWPDFTRLGNRGLVTAAPWHYCLLNVRAGIEETRIYPPTYEWSRLKAEATATTPAPIPERLSSQKWLLAFTKDDQCSARNETTSSSWRDSALTFRIFDAARH